MLGPALLGVATLGVAFCGALAASCWADPRPALRRALPIACAVAVLGASPLLLWSALEIAGLGRRADLGVSALGSAVGLVWLLLCAHPRVRAAPAKGARTPGEKPPGIFPPGFLERVTELARKLGIASVGRVVLVRTLDLGTQAWAVGLVTPTLLVADGIVERLDPAERDAIVAHELAHVATGSLWMLALVPAAAGVAATIASAYVGRLVALFFGVAFLVGLRRVVQRHVESACDVLGARVTGFAAMARALSKIHAVVDLAEVGTLSYVVFATTTHPPRALRLAALRRAAPPEERDAIVVSLGEVVLHRIAAGLAFLAWVAALVAGIKLGRVDDGSYSPAVLGPIALWPTVALALAQSRKLAIVQKRVAQRQTGILLACVGMTLLGISAEALVIVNTDYPFAGRQRELSLAWAVPLLIGALLTGLAMRRSLRQVRARKATLTALQLRDFAGACAIEERFPDVVAHDLGLRHDLALAAALSGARGEAIERLERLAGDSGAPPIVFLTLALLHAEEDAPEQALNAATRAIAKLPKDPGPLFHAARAHRSLGNAPAAAAALERARTIAPRDGGLTAFAALLAHDRGQSDEAQKLLARGLELAPGQPFVLGARAELTLALGPPEAARVAIAAARRASDASPIAFVGQWIGRLERRLGPAPVETAVPPLPASPVPPTRGEGPAGETTRQPTAQGPEITTEPAADQLTAPTPPPSATEPTGPS